MIRGILLLGLLALLPWWVSWGLDRLGVRIPGATQFSGWVKGPPEERPPGPPPGWREERYLARNPDVAAAVRKGAVSSGYAHYVAFGQAEGRVGGFEPAAPAAASPPESPLPSPPLSPPSPPPVAEPLPPPPVPAPVAVAAAPSAAPASPARSPQVPLPRVKPPVPAAAGAASPQAAQAAGQISGIRVGTHQGFTRVVLDVDVPVRLDRPPPAAARSVGVDLPNAVWRTARQGQLIERMLAYRVEDSGPGASRLTLDARTPIQVKALFLLPSEGERRHRVVLDLVRADTGGPLPGKR